MTPPIPDPTPFATLLARCAPEGEAYCRHAFVRGLAEGGAPGVLAHQRIEQQQVGGGTLADDLGVVVVGHGSREIAGKTLAGAREQAAAAEGGSQGQQAGRTQEAAAGDRNPEHGSS